MQIFRTPVCTWRGNPLSSHVSKVIYASNCNRIQKNQLTLVSFINFKAANKMYVVLYSFSFFSLKHTGWIFLYFFSADFRLKIFLYYSLIVLKKENNHHDTFYFWGLFLLCCMLYMCATSWCIVHQTVIYQHLAIATSAGFFILLAIFASWIRFVSQTEESYSKLLARYQSRNGSWFAVNRKPKVKQKRVKRWFRGNADY